MVKISTLFKKKRISRVGDLEINRYTDFLEHSYKNNLEHSKKNIRDFPRWSIISGYYAMHDIAKLFLAKKFRIKIDFNVHLITIQLLKEITKDRELVRYLEGGYKKFLSLASDLEEAKKERIKVQYYTGTPFLKKEYIKNANDFYENLALVYINKMVSLL